MNNLNFNNNQDVDNLTVAPENKKDNKKLIVFIVITVLIIVGIGGYFVFKKPVAPEPPITAGKCGDNVCDEFEKANPNACATDCADKNTEGEGKKSSINYGDSPFGFVQGSFDTNYNFDPSYKNMLDLGVHWDRPFEGHVNTMWTDTENKTTGKGNYDFKKTDAALSAIKEGMNLFFSLPIVNVLYGSDTSRDGNPYPTDSDAVNAYKNFVKTIVGRYSSKVKYWMISQNEFDDLEPLAKNLKAYEDEGFNNTVKYAKAACEAIKEACSDCRPVLGGSVAPWMSFSYQGETLEHDGEEKQIIDNGLYTKLVPAIRKNCADLVIDYHFWYKSDKKDYKTQREIIDKIRKVAPGLDIWNTETGTVDGMKNITEFEQARDIVRLYVYALSYGQKKLFWTNTLEYDWTQDDSNAFDFMGLINNPKNKDGLSHKKLSYYTYKKMVEVLEGSDWDNIQTIQEKDGVYVYKFVKNGKSIWVAWNDNNVEKQITIAGVNSSSIKITEAVPNYETGKEVKDYSMAFKTETKQIIDNKLTINISEIPIFVEGD